MLQLRGRAEESRGQHPRDEQQLGQRTWRRTAGRSGSAAIDAAGAAGIINIFAAGNDGMDNDAFPFDPASYTSPSIVAVAASTSTDRRAYFSNYGATSVDWRRRVKTS